jgi:hypothetical protein
MEYYGMELTCEEKEILEGKKGDVMSVLSGRLN